MANTHTFEAGTPRTSCPNDVWQLTLEKDATFVKVIFLWDVNYQDGDRAAVSSIALCSEPLELDNCDFVQT